MHCSLSFFIHRCVDLSTAARVSKRRVADAGLNAMVGVWGCSPHTKPGCRLLVLLLAARAACLPRLDRGYTWVRGSVTGAVKHRAHGKGWHTRHCMIVWGERETSGHSRQERTREESRGEKEERWAERWVRGGGAAGRFPAATRRQLGSRGALKWLRHQEVKRMEGTGVLPAPPPECVRQGLRRSGGRPAGQPPCGRTEGPWRAQRRGSGNKQFLGGWVGLRYRRARGSCAYGLCVRGHVGWHSAQREREGERGAGRGREGEDRSGEQEAGRQGGQATGGT